MSSPKSVLLISWFSTSANAELDVLLHYLLTLMVTNKNKSSVFVFMCWVWLPCCKMHPHLISTTKTLILYHSKIQSKRKYIIIIYSNSTVIHSVYYTLFLNEIVFYACRFCLWPICCAYTLNCIEYNPIYMHRTSFYLLEHSIRRRFIHQYIW